MLSCDPGEWQDIFQEGVTHTFAEDPNASAKAILRKREEAAAKTVAEGKTPGGYFHVPSVFVVAG